MRPARPFFNIDPRSVGPATKALCIVTLVVSVVGLITQQRIGFGSENITYSAQAILHLEIWRLVTYPFVYYSVQSLLFGLLGLYLFGSSFESTYGTRDFVRFFAFSSIGAGFIALPLHFVIELLGIFRDVDFGIGSMPAITAMLMALALTSPDSEILFLIVQMRARTAIYVTLGISLLYGFMEGGTALSLELGGIAMGYLLVTGIWRPARWFDGIRRKSGRSRSGLYIVPPRRDDTLH
jgi:membrane associated rhomboid family serine protease